MPQAGQHELHAPIETRTLYKALQKAGVSVKHLPFQSIDGWIISDTLARSAAIRSHDIREENERSVLAKMISILALQAYAPEALPTPKRGFQLRGEVSTDDPERVPAHHVLAARLLVGPHIAGYTQGAETLVEFSQRIGVPPSVVELCMATQDRTFEVEPSDWMEKMLNSDDPNAAAS